MYRAALFIQKIMILARPQHCIYTKKNKKAKSGLVNMRTADVVGHIQARQKRLGLY
jgi:hypothetical protein